MRLILATGILQVASVNVEPRQLQYRPAGVCVIRVIPDVTESALQILMGQFKIQTTVAPIDVRRALRIVMESVLAPSVQQIVVMYARLKADSAFVTGYAERIKGIMRILKGSANVSVPTLIRNNLLQTAPVLINALAERFVMPQAAAFAPMVKARAPVITEAALIARPVPRPF